jgi:hypothetical protein
MLYSRTQNEKYLEIKQDDSTKFEFFIQILGAIADNYDYFSLELIKEWYQNTIHSTYYYRYTEETMSFQNTLGMHRNNRLPMVSEPNVWTLSEDNFLFLEDKKRELSYLKFGGYKSNKKLDLDPGLQFIKENIISIKINPVVVQVLNSLQSIACIFKSKKLRSYVKNAPALLKTLKVFISWEKSEIPYSILSLNKDKNKIIISSYRDSNYFATQDRDSYASSFYRIVKIIHSLLVSLAYDGLDIYNPWFLDFRLKMYPIKSIISFQENALVRSILHTKGYRTVRLDASQSSIAIIGGLLGDIDILKHANVLANSEEKEDFFLSVISRINFLNLKTDFFLQK